MENYFYNKNYISIYLHNIFNVFAKSMVSIFWVVLLYKIGFPIWLILLFFAFQFWCMWLLSPLSPILVSKIWLVKSILLSNIFSVIWISLLLIIQDFSSWYLFLIFIFFSIEWAIYHPLGNWLSAIYIKDEHKWRVLSLNIIFKQLSIILSAFTWWYLIATDQNILLILIIILSFILSNLVYFILLEKKEIKIIYHFRDIFKYLFSIKFKENLVPFWFQAFLIIERIFIPLFMFIFIWDFETLSYIVWFSILLEFLILLFFWKRIDTLKNKSFFWATLLKSISSLFLRLLNVNTPLVFFNKTYAWITENIFTNAFWTLIQKKAGKEKNAILFTSAKEIILCFSEFFILVFLSGIAYFIWNPIFIVIFVSSFIAIWIMYFTWKK